MFKISSQYATILSIPATYATAFGFIFSYGQLMRAMSESKLLPSVFNKTLPGSGTPYVALIVGSVLGYVICIVMYFNAYLLANIFNICIFSAFVAYISQCLGYLYLQTKFSNLQRDFRSPLGVAGAVVSLLVWVLCVVGQVAFLGDNQFALIVLVSLIALLTAYYFGYAKARQTFSEEERKILFVAHVINCKCLDALFYGMSCAVMCNAVRQ